MILRPFWIKQSSTGADFEDNTAGENTSLRFPQTNKFLCHLKVQGNWDSGSPKNCKCFSISCSMNTNLYEVPKHLQFFGFSHLIFLSMDGWKNEIMPFTATWMDVEIIIVSEISQTEKDKYHICLHAELKKMIQINLLTKSKQTHRFRELTYGYCYWGK